MIPRPALPLFVLAGPTASGKTALAVQLAQRFDAELVGADSVQVYRGFDLGTAKPRPDELLGVPHHLIDVADPDEPFDAPRFAAQADQVIAEIAARGRRAIVVGGTGLWIRVLLRGLVAAPAPEPGLRRQLLDEAAATGWPALHARLAEVDPVTAARLHPHDGVRIVRALEVALVSGRPLSAWQEEHRFAKERYAATFVALDPDREVLGRDIERRFDGMIAGGLLDEVRALCARWPTTLKPFGALGYKRLVQHLAGELTWAEAVDRAKADTRRFARRQRAWFAGEPDCRRGPFTLDDLVALAGRTFVAS